MLLLLQICKNTLEVCLQRDRHTPSGASFSNRSNFIVSFAVKQNPLSLPKLFFFFFFFISEMASLNYSPEEYRFFFKVSVQMT
jgi:hypothetical protein